MYAIPLNLTYWSTDMILWKAFPAYEQNQVIKPQMLHHIKIVPGA